jgi:branched-subunit amino acid transport protein
LRTELVLAFAVMTAATFFSRAFLTLSVSRVHFSPFMERFLSLVPFCVLTAMVTPYLLLSGDGRSLSLASPWILSGGLTLFASFRTKNLILSVGCGIALFALLGGMG